MANSTSDTLFELITTLSKTEKRFFKLHAGRHTIGEDNNSLQLFDYISKQKTYDEKKLFKDFEGKNFLNKFSIAKYRLYHQILDSLNLFYAKSSIDVELTNSIQSANILFEKGLYNQSKKLLDSVIKKAEKYHLNQIRLQALQAKKQYYEQHFYTTKSAEEFFEMAQEEKDLAEIIAKKSELWYLKTELFKKIHSIGIIRSNDDVKILTKIVRPVLGNKIEAGSIENKYLVHQILSAYYFAIHDSENCFRNLAEIEKLSTQNDVLFKKDKGKYLSLLTNLSYTCIKLRKFEKANHYLETIESLQKEYTQSRDLKVKYFSSYYSLKLFNCIENDTNCDGKDIIEVIEKGLSEYNKDINPIRKAYFYFQLGVYYLAHNNYKQALVSINNVINDKQNLAKEDIFSFAQILQLIIHFELKNYRYLPYVLTSTKRFLKYKNRLYQFESVFLKIISKIKSATITEFELEDILLEFAPEIEKFKDDKFERIAFEYFDFGAWLSSKIKRKSYLEIKKASA